MSGLVKNFILSFASLVALTACSSMKTPENYEPVAKGDGFQSQYRQPPKRKLKNAYLQSPQINQDKCLPERRSEKTRSDRATPAVKHLLGEKLSRNDLVQLTIGGDETLTGSYVVSRNGQLKLPYLPPVKAQGQTPAQVEKALSRALVKAEFYEAAPMLSVHISDFASASVGVHGAVFEPHAVEIGRLSGEGVDTARQNARGASTEARNLSAAIRAAGGIRPDADLSAVELNRGGKLYQLDLRGIFKGDDATDIMMLTGDKITVRSRNCFQEALMRPSPISPPGVSLFLSNLTQPAAGNALSAVGKSVREVPYGTRYLQAVIDTNCVGGVKATNANRTAVLFSRNPITGVSVVIERDIEKLLRRKDRDDFDPFVMPGDAIACYDSDIISVAEVGRILGIVRSGTNR